MNGTVGVLGETPERNLRLCFVSRYFPPMMGSGAPRMEDLSEILAEMGQEIHVVTVVPPRDFPKTGKRHGSLGKNREVYRVNIPDGLPSVIYALLSTLGLFLASLRVTLNSRADLVLATVPNEDSGLAGWLTAKVTGRPFILDVRDDWETILMEESQGLERALTKIVYYVFNILYASADSVVCTSETLRRRISARRGSGKGVLRITNGARPERVQLLTEEEREETKRRYGVRGRLAVFTGTLSRHQAPWNILSAGSELRSRGVKISTIVAGGGPLLDGLRRLSGELDDPVRLIGPVGRDEVTKLVAAGDIGIITLRDSVACRSMIPLKFFDYVAGRIPIVASVPTDSEIAKMIREEKIGIVVEPEDPTELADAIEEVTNSQDLREKFKKNAEGIGDRYDWNTIGRTYLDLMYTTVGHRS